MLTPVQLLMEQVTKMGNSPHPFTPLMIPTSEALALWGQLQHWHKNFGYHLDKIQLPVPQPPQVHGDPTDQPQPSQLASKKRRQQYQAPQDTDAETRSGTTSNLIQDTPINHLDPIAYVSVGNHLDQTPMSTWEAIKHPDRHREWKEHTEWNATTYNTFTEAIHNHPFAQHLSPTETCSIMLTHGRSTVGSTTCFRRSTPTSLHNPRCPTRSTTPSIHNLLHTRTHMKNVKWQNQLDKTTNNAITFVTFG